MLTSVYVTGIKLWKRRFLSFAYSRLFSPFLRLDKDDKLSEHLQLAFFSVAPKFKLHLLLYVLRCVIRSQDQVLVFAATMAHVQFLEIVLSRLGFDCSYLYSDMDPTSRRINAAKFQKKLVNILVATDIAARGIDIPSLDYVINYNFPSSAKVFVHRVGRVARAGKSGIALNFVSASEEPYLWDLHKFLGRAVVFSPKLEVGALSNAVTLDMEPNAALKYSTVIEDNSVEVSNNQQSSNNYYNRNNINWNFHFGSVPEVIFSEEADEISRLLDDPEVEDWALKKDNAYSMYERSRPRASKEAVREMREVKRLITPGVHQLLRESVRRHITLTDHAQEMLERKLIIMDQLKNVKLKKVRFARQQISYLPKRL